MSEDQKKKVYLENKLFLPNLKGKFHFARLNYTLKFVNLNSIAGRNLLLQVRILKKD